MRILTIVALPLAVGLSALGPTALAATTPITPKKPAATTPTKVVSRHLWATIDACNPPDKPHMVGIRGSMPGTGRKDEKMYMRFRMQYESDGTWHYIGSTADTGFRLVGAATYKARQSGFYFSIPPVTGTTYVLRGVVSFEWRKSTKVELSAQQDTSAGHISVAGADPKGYSAAACKLP
ncbi:MAG TPA: hypothetical protein VG165_15580 [Solirubrobacteraceae bacterium]|nr:hypothetical protein [Solirubrobacteraceae bacterium]